MYFYCNYLISRLCYETQGRQGGGEGGKQEVWLYSAVTKCKTSAFRLSLDPFSVTIKKQNKTTKQMQAKLGWLSFCCHKTQALLRCLHARAPGEGVSRWLLFRSTKALLYNYSKSCSVRPSAQCTARGCNSPTRVFLTIYTHKTASIRI